MSDIGVGQKVKGRGPIGMAELEQELGTVTAIPVRDGGTLIRFSHGQFAPLFSFCSFTIL